MPVEKCLGRLYIFPMEKHVVSHLAQPIFDFYPLIENSKKEFFLSGGYRKCLLTFLPLA